MKKYLLPLLALSFSAIHCTKENEKIVVQEKVTQGSMILSGRGIPSAEKGQTGDYYLDLSSSELYGPKTKEGWGNSVLNLKGIKGDKGDNGTNGQDGQPGQNGQPGLTPHIGENGNWWVGNTDLGVKAQGNPGTNGQDGQPGRDGQPGQPGRDGQNGQPGRDGQNGETPRIGDNGNWWIGNEDTGKPARGAQGPQGNPGTNGQNGQPGRDGQNGETPRIGDNGNWWIGNEDTGKPARGAQGPQGNPGTNGQPGRDGQNGHTPRIGENGNWWVGDQDTGKPARGAQGPQGSQGNPGQQGAQGNPGRDGQPGADGSKILAGNGTPQASDGNIGDYFIDKTAKIFYGPKTASGWPTTGISLTGAPMATEDYELSSDGKTLLKWLNPKTSYIDMNLEPKLRNVTTIASGAFVTVPELRDRLSTVIIGDGVTEIQASAFSGCGALRRVELPEGLTAIADFTFTNCISLQYIDIPETVTSIGMQAFSNCVKLKKITIPKGIGHFKSRTFLNCSTLKTLVLENPTAFNIDQISNAFSGTTLTVIYVPHASKQAYKDLNNSRKAIIKSIVIE